MAALLPRPTQGQLYALNGRGGAPANGLPERLSGAESEFFLPHMLRAWAHKEAFDPESFAEYLCCFQNPDTIQATCAE